MAPSLDDDDGVVRVFASRVHHLASAHAMATTLSREFASKSKRNGAKRVDVVDPSKLRLVRLAFLLRRRRHRREQRVAFRQTRRRLFRVAPAAHLRQDRRAPTRSRARRRRRLSRLRSQRKQLVDFADATRERLVRRENSRARRARRRRLRQRVSTTRTRRGVETRTFARARVSRRRRRRRLGVPGRLERRSHRPADVRARQRASRDAASQRRRRLARTTESREGRGGDGGGGGRRGRRRFCPRPRLELSRREF